MITGIIGILMQPWRLLADPARYIDGWLVGYSGGMSAIAGVLIIDYWVIRRKRLVLPDLYRKQGAYTYASGWNWRAVAATLIGCFVAWIGLFVPSLRTLYDAAWFVGFAASAISYLILMRLAPPQIVAATTTTITSEAQA
jgi:NCS1 family nucleobase:cation symporter-1